MIKWSEEQRETDYGVFCRKAVELYRGAVFFIFYIKNMKI